MRILMTLVACEGADAHPFAEVEIDDQLLAVVAKGEKQPVKNIRRASFIADETTPFIQAMLDKLNEQGLWT